MQQQEQKERRRLKQGNKRSLNTNMVCGREKWRLRKTFAPSLPITMKHLGGNKTAWQISHQHLISLIPNSSTATSIVLQRMLQRK
mmetsp:Transcript_89813/g.179372  ORF Transcript_89813/g.179372 Transcript_89813/m.179372 type:complete len:85 (-) Transcript_89813:722-976(-)